MSDREKQFFTRGEASNYLEYFHGIRLTPNSLAKRPPCKGGPPFVKYDRNVAYRKTDLDFWATSRAVEVR